MVSSYQKTKPFDHRCNESRSMKDKYPDRVCVICERSASAGSIGNLDKNKYLVPRTLTVGQFMHIIRKRLDIDSVKALFLFTEAQVLPPTSMMMVDLYASHKHDDGLLYLTYATENTFG